MKLAAVSDLHGHLPVIPPCDVLLIAGDICPHFGKPGGVRDIEGQLEWLTFTFKRWLDNVPATHVVATWGNHDWAAYRTPERIPSLRWYMLVDEAVILDGIKFYGTPHQPIFYNWAFNLPEDKLALAWDLIPEDTDVLVCHGPPRGYGDFTMGCVRTGSPSQLERIKVVKPKLTVFGHIHEDRGQWDLNGSILANVTTVNEDYRPIHEPMIFEI